MIFVQQFVYLFLKANPSGSNVASRSCQMARLGWGSIVVAPTMAVTSGQGHVSMIILDHFGNYWKRTKFNGIQKFKFSMGNVITYGIYDGTKLAISN